MLLRNLTRIFVLIFISLFLYSCPPEITLHGDITGVVTDAVTSEPVQGAFAELIQSYVKIDSTYTGSDGAYIFKNVTTGEYEIQASKYSYGTRKENVTVVSAKTHTIDFALNKIPLPEISPEYLDFC